jgi:hypothetical protein
VSGAPGPVRLLVAVLAGAAASGAIAPPRAVAQVEVDSAASRAAPRDAEGPGLPPTHAEAADWLASTPPDSAFPWLERLAERIGPRLRVDTLAVIPAAGAFPAVIPVATIGADGIREPSAAEEPGRLRVLILGSQHGDERAGYEVALRLARDLAGGELRPLLAVLDVAVVPALNPVGMRLGTREDAAGIDPNRDHATLSSPAVRSLWRLHAAWRPHVVLDLHEMGPSPYAAQVGLPTHPNVDPGLVELARFRLLPHVVRRLAEADVRFHEYVALHPDPAEPPVAGADTFVSLAPIAASNARNAFSLAGAIGLLLETASAREIDDLRERSDRLHLLASSFLEVIAGLEDEVRARTGRGAHDDPTPLLSLRARNVADPERPFLRWQRWNERGVAVPDSLAPWRPVVETLAELPVPGAWAIRPGAADLAALLARHGIRIERLERPVRLRVGVYREPDAPTFEVRTLEAGSWIVPADQPGQRLAFTLVEPGSEDGWFGAAAPVTGHPPGAEPPVVRIERPLPDLPLRPADPVDAVGPAPELRG